MRLTTEQRVKVTVNPLTAAGNPAAIDGEVTFTSSDELVASIVRIDATSAYVVAGVDGASQITATFDARLGEEVVSITASGSVEVVAAEADHAEITFGEPEPK